MSDRWLDPEQKFYNFHTAEIEGNNIFDTRKASNSDAQQILDGSSYWREEKNTYSEIIEMTPYEYFEACARDCFSESTEQLITSRRRDSHILAHLTEVIKKYNKRFPIPYLDYATFNTPSQEGLHRMMVAGDLFGWDTKFPVQIIKWVDEDRAVKAKEWKHKRQIERYLEIALTRALRYKYYDIDELKDQLLSEFESEVRYVDEFENKAIDLSLIFKDDETIIAQVNGKYEVEFNIEDVQFYAYDDELEDIDLDDLDSWINESLPERFTLNKKYALPEEFLKSSTLLDALTEKFGADYSSQPICKDVCLFIKELCPECEVLDFVIAVWRELKMDDLELISNKGHCVIRYKDKLYDYTSDQYLDYGISAKKSQPRILTLNDSLSKLFDMNVYSDRDYIISTY